LRIGLRFLYLRFCSFLRGDNAPKKTGKAPLTPLKVKTGSAVMTPVTVAHVSTSKLQQARLKDGSKHNTTDD
jgi:hypothetical protein